MNTDQLFYESIEEALRTAVQACGGTKKVAAILWPTLPQDRAAQRLTDCLNESRAEKLGPAEVIRISRMGREVGCHAVAAYSNNETGYASPIPIDPADERAELMREFVEMGKRMERIAQRIGSGK